jgi:formamidopyrimidine-DNA glycosylase
LVSFNELESEDRAERSVPERLALLEHVLDAGDERTHELLYKLGPEPLSKDLTPEYLLAQLARRKIALKPALMDQKLVVGVGNIYASESLFLCKINPYIQSDSIKSRKQAEALITAIRATLNAAIKSGGSTLRDYVGAGNEGGYFQHHFDVYGRDDAPCFTCGTNIKTAVQAGRTTYWCVQCQPIRATRQKH